MCRRAVRKLLTDYVVAVGSPFACAGGLLIKSGGVRSVDRNRRLSAGDEMHARRYVRVVFFFWRPAGRDASVPGSSRATWTMIAAAAEAAAAAVLIDATRRLEWRDGWRPLSTR